MSNIPSDLHYTPTHEWVRQNEDGTITVGVTHHAQALLGDLVFVELPDVGTASSGDECGVLESVKAASDLYCPLSGEVIEVNEALTESPDLINNEPYGDGWIFRMELDDDEDLQELLDADNYLEKIESD